MIPSVAHFVWFGTALPWAYALAAITAARRGALSEVLVHHADTPDDGPGWRALADEPRVRLVPLDPCARLAAIPEHGDALVRLYARLSAPAARTNVVRAAILHAEGGIYLDTDTITIASLDPLRADPLFCGLEHIVMPYRVRRSRSPLAWGRVAALSAIREGLRRLPVGHRVFPYVAPLYHAAANNAVLGAHAGHAFIGALLAAMARTPEQRATVRFALGTNLLQEAIDGDGPGRRDLVLHPPEVFYPLPPEISEHWFRGRRSVDLRQAITPRTRIIHWYASVRTKAIVPRIDMAWIEAHAATQLFSAAALRALTAGAAS